MRTRRRMLIVLALATLLVMAQVGTAAELCNGRADYGTGGLYGQIGKLDTSTMTSTLLGTIGDGVEDNYDVQSLAWDGTYLYTTKGLSDVSHFHVIDPTTGLKINPVDTTIAERYIGSLAYDYDLGVLWGGGGTNLVAFDPVTQVISTSIPKSTGIGRRIDGLAYGNGTIYGLEETGEVYSVDSKVTGGTTLIADVTTGWACTGLAFDEASGLLYVTEGVSISNMWSVDPTTAAVVDLGVISGDPTRADGLSPIPEPVTLSLLGLGGVLAMFRRLRRRR